MWQRRTAISANIDQIRRCSRANPSRRIRKRFVRPLIRHFWRMTHCTVVSRQIKLREIYLIENYMARKQIIPSV